MAEDWANHRRGSGPHVDSGSFGRTQRFLIDYSSKPEFLDSNGFIGYDRLGNGLTTIRVTLNANMKIYNAFPASALR